MCLLLAEWLKHGVAGRTVIAGSPTVVPGAGSLPETWQLCSVECCPQRRLAGGVAAQGVRAKWFPETSGWVICYSASAPRGGVSVWVACGFHCVRQHAQTSDVTHLCRREHQSEGPGGGVGTACGRLWPWITTGLRLVAAPYGRIVDQILHPPAWATAGMSHHGLGCCVHGVSLGWLSWWLAAWAWLLQSLAWL